MTDSLAPTRSGRRIPLALALVATGVPMFMATLDNLVVTNALPVIGTDLDASIENCSGSSTPTRSPSRASS